MDSVIGRTMKLIGRPALLAGENFSSVSVTTLSHMGTIDVPCIELKRKKEKKNKKVKRKKNCPLRKKRKEFSENSDVGRAQTLSQDGHRETFLEYRRPILLFTFDSRSLERYRPFDFSE